MRFYLLLFMYVLIMLGLYFMGMALVWYVVTTVLIVSVIIIGVSTMRFNLFLQVQSKLQHAKNNVALTFDDGPDSVLTPQVLDLLKEYNAKATFFCIGNKISENEHIIKRLTAEGHSVGNHTYEHSNTFPVWSIKKMKQSIHKTDELIYDIVGVKCILFRPPFGVTNNLIAIVLKKLGKKTVGWSIRTKDTCKRPDKVINKVKKHIKPGAIVLFHDTNPNILVELKETLEYCQMKKLTSIALV